MKIDILLDELIMEVNKRPVNIKLHYFICRWNDSYCINTSLYMKKFPDTKYVYTTNKEI